MWKKIISILIVSIMGILISSIIRTKPKQVEVNEMHIAKPSVAIEVPKKYTQYETNITFNDNHFKGKHIVRYVYDGEEPTDKLLFKLYLNTYKEDSMQKPYFIDNVPSVNNPYEAYGYIKVSEIKVDREPCKAQEKVADLWIQLPNKVQKGQAIEVEMAIEGAIPSINYRIGSNNKAVWASGFLPQLAVYDKEEGWVTTNSYNSGNYIYAEVSDYNVSFNVNRDIRPIGTGVLIEEMNDNNGNKKYVFEAKRVRDFGVYLAPSQNEFRMSLKNGKNIYIYSKEEIDVERYKTKIEAAFDYYSGIFGTYPYENFYIIDDSDRMNPIGYPNLLIGNLERLFMDEEKCFEAIGKQWIPYIIMHHLVKEDCLNEGLEFYVARRATMSLESMEKYIAQLKTKESFNKVSEIPYVTYQNYYKEEVLRPLEAFMEMEQAVGEQRWKSFLGKYYKKYAFRLPGDSEFITFFLEESNMPLSKGFYDYQHILH